ncbi:DUF5522 domain-containing protein [Runella zeae]|uniref:DUF5522 domain-containing protein n=1 Tax=Runella zeae TaxID=94255 RepID=UPI002354756F|nr:DUF5522 domain-containing protein [Runella zeae]
MIKNTLSDKPASHSGKSQTAKRHGLAEEDYYTDPNGFLVFTAAYHLKRGYCCKNGCRHCPYGFKKEEKKR